MDNMTPLVFATSEIFCEQRYQSCYPVYNTPPSSTYNANNRFFITFFYLNTNLILKYLWLVCCYPRHRGLTGVWFVWEAEVGSFSLSEKGVIWAWDSYCKGTTRPLRGLRLSLVLQHRQGHINAAQSHTGARINIRLQYIDSWLGFPGTGYTPNSHG